MAAVAVPEEQRTWMKNEMARRLVAVYAAAVRKCIIIWRPCRHEDWKKWKCLRNS